MNFFCLLGFLMVAQTIPLELNTSVKQQMNITEGPAGTYDIETTGGDPWIITKAIANTYDQDEVYVVSFLYDAPAGLDNLELRYRDNASTFNGIRRLNLGSLPATSGLTPYKIFIKLDAVEWDKAYTVFRFDFGVSANQNLQVKDIQLRAPTRSEVVEIDLDVTGKNQMNISQNTDGSYSILTTGGDPWVKSQLLSETYDYEETYIMTFQYLAVNGSGAFGIDDVQIFYGFPPAGARSVTLGEQPAAPNWKTASVNLKLRASQWNQAYDGFRFDMGRRADLNIKVRNFALRAPTPAEIAATTPVNNIPITLNLNSQAQMDAVQNADGSYTIETLGNDPRITSNTIEQFYDYNETFYMSFEYIASEGLDNLTVFYGPPSPTRKIDFGDLEPTEVYKNINVNMKQFKTWNSMFTQFRFDFGTSPNQLIQVRNIRLRKPTQEELDNDPIIINQKNNAFLSNYFNSEYTSEVAKAMVTQDSVFVQTIIPQNSGNLFLCELKMYNAIFEPEDITFSLPLSSEEFIETELERFIDVEGETYDRIYSRWVIAEKNGDDYIYVSSAKFPDDIYKANKRYLAEEKPLSVKGIGASAGPQYASDLSDLGAENVRTGILYGSLLSLVPTSMSYEFNGKTYYFNPNYVNRLDQRYKNSTDNGLTTTVIILIPSNIEADKKVILTHPDADSDAFFSIANVTSPIGVEYYAAMTSFLAERYTRPDELYGRITNWIIHNEVDAGSEWTNAGEKPMDIYTELYDRSMRTAYYSIRQFDPAAKVFISLTQFWNAAVDYPPRLMLQTLNKLSETGGDYEWGIAHHPYPQNGSATWNDIQVTNDLMTSPKITPKNIELMDTWIRSKENLYKGLKVRSLMFTEQGINAGRDYDEETFQRQAAGVAYMWKKFSRLPSTEAIHYHRLVDNASLFPVHFGLWTRDEASNAPEKRGIRKPSWYVWQAADTENEEEAFEFALPIINVSSWEETFNTLMGEVNLCDVTFNLTNDESVASDIEIYFNGEMHRSENDGFANFYNAASLPDERTIRYVTNDTLIWPELTLVVQEDKEVFMDLKPVDNLEAVGISPTQILVKWDDITDFEDGFIIERRSENESNFTLLESVLADTTSYLDEGLTPGMRYYYRIRAFNEEVRTINSNEVDVLAPFLLVDYKDGDKNKPQNNKIRPHVILRNEAENSIDLNRATVRYWFTAEDYSPLRFKAEKTGIFDKKSLHGDFVAVEPVLDGADYYLELSLDSNSQIPAMGSSGEIRMKIEKSRPSPFNELNDYSYKNASSFQETRTITVYWDGELIWGEEPNAVQNSTETETVTSSILSVYPNPAKNSTNLKWAEDIISVGNFTLYDYYNVQHTVKTNINESDVLSVKLPNLKQGLYILKGQINGEEILYRLLVE
ncbi:DUF5722 domain-containing protein [Changchengzhania lutea]|uniref:DUF5722 domain-containing protein n=1 Tax=Changchengzhania lutea TaxID=2049305 RepID=UPI00163D5135|nr:DUF5722 domain-containing protein [Changchengzhania lutea]